MTITSRNKLQTIHWAKERGAVQLENKTNIMLYKIVSFFKLCALDKSRMDRILKQVIQKSFDKDKKKLNTNFRPGQL